MSEDDDLLEVIPLDGPVSVHEVLKVAQDQPLDYVLLIGQTKAGQWYFASSEKDPFRAIYSVDQFRDYMTG